MTMQITSTLSTPKLVQQQLEEFQKYPGWHGALSSQEAIALLTGKDAFTYIVSAGENDASYKVNWMTQEGVVKEKSFHLDSDPISGSRYYRNGVTVWPGGMKTYIMAEIGQIGMLLSKMIGCDEYQMRPLNKT